MGKGCRNPTLSLVVYSDATNPLFVFVKVPDERGRYVRTHRCVTIVPCSHETCGSVVGEPCKTRDTDDGYHSNPHWSRIRDARRLRVKSKSESKSRSGK